MKGTVLYDVKDGIAILTVDNPPVNPLSDGVRTGLFESLVKAEEDSSVIGVVLTGNGRAFIAGADISEFGGNVEGISLNEVFNKSNLEQKEMSRGARRYYEKFIDSAIYKNDYIQLFNEY